MIGWLKGYIVDRPEDGHIVLSVNQVGYDIEIPLNVYSELLTEIREVTLFIQTIVREDAFLLYGFLEKVDRAVFRTLIKVSGVGPKLAMTILSHLSVIEFQQAIQNKDLQRLISVPGIGKKTAERLQVELKSAFATLPEAFTFNVSSPHINSKEEAIAALITLGYRLADARAVIQAVSEDDLDTQQLIKRGLQQLSRV